jgi:hypothetical protein
VRAAVGQHGGEVGDRGAGEDLADVVVDHGLLLQFSTA